MCRRLLNGILILILLAAGCTQPSAEMPALEPSEDEVERLDDTSGGNQIASPFGICQVAQRA